MITITSSRSLLALVTLVTLALAIPALAQTATPESQPATQPMEKKMGADCMMGHGPTGGAKAGKMACCEGMGGPDAMAKKMDEMDAKVEKMVGVMNAATGKKKEDAMAALLTELVAQRKNMRDMCMQAGPMMMKHAMHHMMMSMDGGCDMMTSAKDGGAATQPADSK